MKKLVYITIIYLPFYFSSNIFIKLVEKLKTVFRFERYRK